MSDFESYRRLLLDLIELNYRILKVRSPYELIRTRDASLHLYDMFELRIKTSNFDDDQLMQLDLLMHQVDETNAYVIEFLERKLIMMKIQKRIRRDREHSYLDLH